MSQKILLGKISSSFGIKGEIKLISYCKNASDIENYPLFDKNNKAIKLKLSNKTIVGQGGGGAILIGKIDGVNDRNHADSLRNLELFTNRANFNDELDEEEYYQADLIGLKVIDETEKTIGKVLNVFDFGGGAMLEIEFEKANADLNLEKIENFPFKNEFFPKVDVKNGFVQIVLPEIVKTGNDVG